MVYKVNPDEKWNWLFEVLALKSSALKASDDWINEIATASKHAT